MRWAFWRRGPSEPQRALPDDIGLPTTPRPPAAPATRDQDDLDEAASRRGSERPADRATSKQATDGPSRTPDPPLAAPAPDIDRATLAAAGPEIAALVTALAAGTSAPDHRTAGHTDDRTLAVAATAVLAARLPALSGVDGDLAFDEPADELLHAYAELLATRAQHRRGADREDLLAVAHLAAAAAAVDAAADPALPRAAADPALPRPAADPALPRPAADPALLLLAGVPADEQLRSAALLLAQTADDGGDAPDRLGAEVRALFAPPG